MVREESKYWYNYNFIGMLLKAVSRISFSTVFIGRFFWLWPIFIFWSNFEIFTCVIINIKLEDLLFSAHKPFQCAAGDIMLMVLASRRLWTLKLYHSSYHCGRVLFMGSFDQHLWSSSTVGIMWNYIWKTWLHRGDHGFDNFLGMAGSSLYALVQRIIDDGEKGEWYR